MKVIASSAILTSLKAQAAPCLILGVYTPLNGSVMLVDTIAVESCREGSGTCPGGRCVKSPMTAIMAHTRRTHHPHAAALEVLPHGLVVCGAWAESEQAALQHLAGGSERRQLVLAYPSRSEDPSAPPAIKLAPATAASSSAPADPEEVVILDPSVRPTGWIRRAGLQLVRFRASLQLSLHQQGGEALGFAKALSAALKRLEDELTDPRLAFVLTSR